MSYFDVWVEYNVIVVKLTGENMKKYGIFAFGGGANDILENFEKSCLYDKISVDSDISKLEKVNADIKIQIGENITKGHGCGSNSDFGAIAFETDYTNNGKL